jgi:hypothetical protein
MATAKTPAEKAAHARRQALYRERQKLIKAKLPVPSHLAPKRPATYRPPALKTSVKQKAIARVDARQSAAQRASDAKTAAYNARAAKIRTLPQVHNPKRNIHAPDDEPREVTRQAEAAKIRKSAANQRIQTLGRGLKRDFKNGDFEGLEDVLDTEAERRRYRELTARIAAVSPQALAIYFHNEGGSSEFNIVIKEIRYPPDGGGAGDGLKRLKKLAKSVEKAERLYGETAIVKDEQGNDAMLGRLDF